MMHLRRISRFCLWKRKCVIHIILKQNYEYSALSVFYSLVSTYDPKIVGWNSGIAQMVISIRKGCEREQTTYIIETADILKSVAGLESHLKAYGADRSWSLSNVHLPFCSCRQRSSCPISFGSSSMVGLPGVLRVSFWRVNCCAVAERLMTILEAGTPRPTARSTTESWNYE